MVAEQPVHLAGADSLLQAKEPLTHFGSAARIIVLVNQSTFRPVSAAEDRLPASHRQTPALAPSACVTEAEARTMGRLAGKVAVVTGIDTPQNSDEGKADSEHVEAPISTHEDAPLAPPDTGA